MKMIIMQCDCGEDVTVATNTEARKIMGWCLKCGKLYDVGCPEIGDVDIAEMIQKAHRIKDEEKPKGAEEALFYLRCTDAQLVTNLDTGS